MPPQRSVGMLLTLYCAMSTAFQAAVRTMPPSCSALRSGAAITALRRRSSARALVTKGTGSATGPKLPRKRAAKNWRVLSLYRKAQGAISAGAFTEAHSILEECLQIDEHDPYCWLSLARLEAQTADADQARALFERGCATCPDNVHLVHAHAVFEQRAGQPDAARRLFARAAKLEPGNAYVSHAWGLLEESMGNVSAAQHIYAASMEVRPRVQVCVAWGALELHRGNLSGAREVYVMGWEAHAEGGGQYGGSRAPYGEGSAPIGMAASASEGADAAAGVDAAAGASGPTHTAASGRQQGERRGEAVADGAAKAARGNDASRKRDGTSELVELLLAWSSLERAAGNITSARGLLETARARAPINPKVPLEMANLEISCGNDVAAREAFARGVDMPGAKANDDGANGFSELFNAWATFEARRSDMAAAMAVLARGRQRYPKDASLHQTLGMLLKRSQDVDGARASFTRSLQIKEHAPTYVAFALLEAEQGHPERARDLFDKGAAADPSHVPLYSARAKFELSRGGVAAARVVLEEAVVRYPSPTLWHGWGKLEERQGNLDKAAELYGKGARSGRGGDDPSYLWHSLGSVLLQQRQLPAALRAFEEGLSRRPSSSQLLLGAAIVHGQLGHHEKGRQMFLQAIQAEPSHAHACTCTCTCTCTYAYAVWLTYTYTCRRYRPTRRMRTHGKRGA